MYYSFNGLDTIPKEDAFIQLVSELDELPEYDVKNQRRILQVWKQLEELHGVQVSTIDAWGFFDAKHGTNIADGLRAMAARLTGGTHG